MHANVQDVFFLRHQVLYIITFLGFHITDAFSNAHPATEDSLASTVSGRCSTLEVF